MPSYVDFGDVVKGFTGAAQAVGALSDLNRKLTYGDREYQAELKAKENQAAIGELTLQKAQDEENRKKLDNQFAEARVRFKKTEEDWNNAGRLNAPLPTDSVRNSIMISSSNPRLLADIKKGISSNNWKGVEDYKTLASENFTLGSEIVKTGGQLSQDQYDRLRDQYIKTRQYSDPKFNLSRDQVKVELDGVYQIDKDGNHVAKLESENPLQLAQGMQYQSKAATAVMNESLRQFGTDNYANFSKEGQKSIDVLEHFNSLLKRLPSGVAAQAKSLYQAGTIDQLEKTAIPALEKLAKEHDDSTNWTEAKNLVLNQSVIHNGKPTTLGKALKNTKDPEKYMALLEQGTNSTFETEAGRNLADRYGMTPEQTITKLAEGKVKTAEQTEKLLKPEETKAGINLKKAETGKAIAQTGEIYRKSKQEVKDSTLRGYASEYDRLRKENQKLSVDSGFMSGTAKKKAQDAINQNNVRIKNLEEVLSKAGYGGFQAIPSPNARDFTSPFGQ